MHKTALILLFLFRTTLSSEAQVLLQEGIRNPMGDTLIKNKDALHFIAMGDWGRNGADHQKHVAAQMTRTANQVNPQFVIATGDNFYPHGIMSEFDPLWKYSFEDIYTDYRLHWDWYPVLGNHDYIGNPDAQVAYSKISRRWRMSARYYTRKFVLKGNKVLLVAFIDTNPLIPDFYNNSQYGPNVRTQDSTAQKKWLEEVLADTSRDIQWKMVVGHHPMYTGGGRTESNDTRAIRNTLKPLFDKYKVDIYLSGHEHSLQHMVPEGVTHHFISGAASERTPARLLEFSKLSASEYGFMLFSVTAENLLVQTIDHQGNIIYTTEIRK